MLSLAHCLGPSALFAVVNKITDIARTGVEARLHDVPLNCLAASGAAGESFFVVLTLQKGAAPAVESSGAGLDAVVKVGKQKVVFDGARIVVDAAR